jgi:hypothetical protein
VDSSEQNPQLRGYSSKEIIREDENSDEEDDQS